MSWTRVNIPVSQKTCILKTYYIIGSEKNDGVMPVLLYS